MADFIDSEAEESQVRTTIPSAFPLNLLHVSLETHSLVACSCTFGPKKRFHN